MKIYTITLMKTIRSSKIDGICLPEFIDRRCVGYYRDFESAFMAITICNLDKKNYEYCIIEEVPEGIFKDTPRRWLFEREGTCEEDYVYVQTTEPQEISNVRNFGIG